MSEKTCVVSLLTSTPNAMELIYAAYRQCYHKGYIADMWPALVNGTVTREEQYNFIENVLKSGHDSPVEHVSFSFAIEGISRALTHQLVRHRLASYSQQSQRYVDASDFDYIEPPHIKRIPEAHERFMKFLQEVSSAYIDLQHILEDNGRGKKSNEDARFVLPQAAESKIVVTMNCRSLLHFFNLRCCNRAQWEIRIMANMMLEICKNELPVIFNFAGPKCIGLGYCPESKKFSCGKYPTQEEFFAAGE